MSAILKQKLIDIANGFTKYGLWKGGGSSSLSEMTDVTLSNLQANDILKYNGSVWVNDDDLQKQIDTLNSNLSNYVRWSGGSNAIIQRFWVNCGSVASRSLLKKTITFGKEMPSANYIVSLTMIGTPAYWSNIAISASDKSKTGFVINLFNNGDYTVDNVYIDWIVLSY